MGNACTTAAAGQEIDVVAPADAAPIELYGMKGSLSCLCPMIWMEDNGVKYDFKETFPPDGTRTAEYLANFPMHTIPGMKDGSLCLTDGPVILSYLANKHGVFTGLGAYPLDKQQRAKIDMMTHWRVSTFFTAFAKVVMPVLGFMPPFSEEDNVKNREALLTVLGEFKAFLGDGPFLGGATPSAADYNYAPFFVGLRTQPALVPPEWVPKYIDGFKAASPNFDKLMVDVIGFMDFKASELKGKSEAAEPKAE